MKNLLSGLVFGVAILGVVQSASAQSAPVVSLTSGFQGLKDVGDANSHGWYLGVTSMQNRWFGVIAEMNGAYGGSDDLFSNTRWQDHSLLGGVRFSGTRRIAPFGQVQVGVMHSRTNQQGTVTGARMGFPVQTDSWAKNSFVFQPGGGVEIAINRHLRLRAGVDFQVSQYVQARSTFGVVVPLGGR